MFVKLHFSATSPGTSNHDSWKSEKNGGRTRTSRFFHGARRKYILVPVGDAAFLYSTHTSLKINPDRQIWNAESSSRARFPRFPRSESAANNKTSPSDPKGRGGSESGAICGRFAASAINVSTLRICPHYSRCYSCPCRETENAVACFEISPHSLNPVANVLFVANSTTAVPGTRVTITTTDINKVANTHYSTIQVHRQPGVVFAPLLLHVFVAAPSPLPEISAVRAVRLPIAALHKRSRTEGG